jgi:hypothetical protein
MNLYIKESVKRRTKKRTKTINFFVTVKAGPVKHPPGLPEGNRTKYTDKKLSVLCAFFVRRLNATHAPPLSQLPSCSSRRFFSP